MVRFRFMIPEQVTLGHTSLILVSGIYFKLDNERCFCAHIDARSAEVRDCPVASDEGGHEIKVQMKKRLVDALKVDSWNIEHAEFGKDIYLQSPHYNEKVLNWKYSPSTSWFTVQAIREFCLACALHLHVEIAEVEETPPKKNQTIDQKRRSADRVEAMKEKALEFENIGLHTPVETDYHAFIVRSFELTDKILKLGYQAVNGRRSMRDLRPYERIKLNQTEDLWRFGIEEDDIQHILRSERGSIGTRAR